MEYATKSAVFQFRSSSGSLNIYDVFETANGSYIYDESRLPLRAIGKVNCLPKQPLDGWKQE
ncbi:hypothetical protein, partial [Natronobacterium gregoryi]|uniref:hypothetical protein n=1 Tax=Natronobacterium gregoryi TaxID=44930 RepID=UPI001E38AC93